MKTLEAMVEAANSEKKTAENQLAEAQENCKAFEIEATRLNTALEAAKEKVRTDSPPTLCFLLPMAFNSFRREVLRHLSIQNRYLSRHVFYFFFFLGGGKVL